MAYTIVRFGTGYNAITGAVVGNVLEARTATTALQYPYTLGGVTLGFTDGPTAVAPQAAAGWLSGDALPLQGVVPWVNTGTRTVRIDMPEGPGEYRIILGSVVRFSHRDRWRVNDGVGGTTRLDRSLSGLALYGTDAVPVNTNQWHDHNGVVRPIRAPVDVLSATPETINLSTGVLEFVLGGPHGGGTTLSSHISFIAFQPVDPPTSGAVRMMYHLLA